MVGEVKKEELIITEETQYLNHKKKKKPRTPSLTNLSWTLPYLRDLSCTLLQIFLEATGTKIKWS
jgi:hypothetical protein